MAKSLDKKKKKKQSKKENEETASNTSCDSFRNGEAETIPWTEQNTKSSKNAGENLLKKKKKKKRKHSHEPDIEPSEVDDMEESVSTIRSKKKKHKSKSKDTDYSNEIIETNTGKSDDSKEKKKKKKRKLSADHQDECNYDEKGESKDSSVLNVESDMILKKKKKKKKKRSYEKCDMDEEASVPESEIIPPKNKKRKEKTNNSLEDVQTQNDSVGKSSKKKKKSDIDDIKDMGISDEVDNDSLSKVKKKKKKQSTESSDDNKPTDISKEVTTSTSDMNGEGNHNHNPVEGQWQGNLFETEDRQNKFLRLLGGMKTNETKGKGLFSSTKSSKGKGLFGSLGSVKHNVALSVNAAASLNQSLEDDYNKAITLKFGGGKGSGFGFTRDPAEGKKFHIDTKSVKSKKFEDSD